MITLLGHATKKTHHERIRLHPYPGSAQAARTATCWPFAREKGGTDAAVEISEGSGLSVTVRKGKIETIEQNKDKGIGVTVYVRPDAAATPAPPTSPPPSLRATVEAAYNIARFTAEDDCAGLPDADLLEMNPRDLQPVLPVATSAPRKPWCWPSAAKAAAFDVDPRITNSEGASVYVQQSHFVVGQYRAVSAAGYPFSRHTLSVAPIAGKGAQNAARRLVHLGARPEQTGRRRKASAATPPNAPWRA